MTSTISDEQVLSALRKWYGDEDLIWSDLDTDGIDFREKMRRALAAAERTRAPDPRVVDVEAIARAYQDAIFTAYTRRHEDSDVPLYLHHATARAGVDLEQFRPMVEFFKEAALASHENIPTAANMAVAESDRLLAIIDQQGADRG